MRGPPARREEPQEQYPALEGIIQAASELMPGDRVVYPNQGVCRVVGVEQKNIAGQHLELVKLTREEDGASVMVPKGKVQAIGLRRVATAEQIEGVFHYLGASYDDPELDWKIRHRDNTDRLITGGVLGVAEVVKGLHGLSRIRPLPPKEREQYDNARHLLVHEIAVSLGVPPVLAEDYIDYALMPPAGVQFKLKPPPKPVSLPIHTFRQLRRPVVPVEEDDLELTDLDLDLGALGAPPPGVTEESAAIKTEEETAAPVIGIEDMNTEELAEADEEVPTPVVEKPARPQKVEKPIAKIDQPRRVSARRAAPKKPSVRMKVTTKKTTTKKATSKKASLKKANPKKTVSKRTAKGKKKK